MTQHMLKCYPKYFEAVKDGTKPFECRYNDRDCIVFVIML